jgi:hypothetical protein
MVDIALQSRILSMLRDGRAALIEAAPDRPTSPAPQWRAGQTLEARVETKLADGRSLIDVEGTLFQVRLPERQETQVGQRLQLTVIRPGPEPTLMLRAPDSEAPAENTSSRVSLSTLASRVAAMLSEGNTGTSNAPARSAAPTPLLPILPAPPTTGAALAAPLRQALETSGLFYESHQAEWVGGKRDLEALRQEPQARIAREEQAKATPDRADGARSIARQDDEALTATRSTPTPTMRSEPTTAAPPPTPIPPAVAGIVDRQLDAIANQQIVWQGQVWPGQTMDWRVEEQEARSGEEEGGARWRTELRLQLPVLGAMTARLDLNGEHLAIAIDAGGGPVSVTTMRTGEGELRAMLEARGLALDTFRVADDAGT